jgi:hypothetical protein
MSLNKTDEQLLMSVLKSLVKEKTIKIDNRQDVILLPKEETKMPKEPKEPPKGGKPPKTQAPQMPKIPPEEAIRKVLLEMISAHGVMTEDEAYSSILGMLEN